MIPAAIKTSIGANVVEIIFLAIPVISIIVIILTPRRGCKTRGILGVGMPREEKSF